MLSVRATVWAALFACGGSVCPAIAHHSFAAQFDGSKPVRLIGFITKIEWTNPHSYFYLKMINSKGEAENWACESGAPGPLSRRGWKKGDVKLGDRLIVDGYLARDGSRFIDARRITLPDGRVLLGDTAGGQSDQPGSDSAARSKSAQ